MNIVIDLTPIFDFITQPIDVVLWQLFITIGWIPIAITLLWGFFEIWMEYINGQWARQQKYMMLAIDIPRGNAQSPKAVENMFAYLAGAHGSINLIETYWEGRFQRSLSFEIVSIDGYTQFMIRIPVDWRYLVESAIYSQYPDAEITEVNDYTENVPKRFPDEEWDIAGMEFVHAKSSAYPIKTYEEFEHKFGEPEFHYKDPMAALMDLCASLRKGEQLWYQIIVTPIDMVEWTKMGDIEVKKILKEDVPAEKNAVDKVTDALIGWIGDFSEFVYKLWGDVSEAKPEKKDEPLKMMNLKPKEKKQIEAIHNKISKIGFNTKVRFVYIAKKDVMNKPKVVNGFVGYMKQFAALDLNNLKPEMKKTAISAHYFFRDARINSKKNSLFQNYAGRDGSAGNTPGTMNTEELATIWHFPVESVVKAPLIGKAPGRKAEPPSNIPIGEVSVAEELSRPIFEQEVLGKGQETRAPETSASAGSPRETAEDKERGTPPANLPFA